MNILITGGCGYIGSELCTKLASYPGVTVYCVDNLMYNQGAMVHQWLRQYENIKFFNYDVNEGGYYHLLEDVNIVIPLAARVGMPLCQINPELAIKTNYESVKNLVDRMKKTQLLIYLNTNSSYGTVPNGVCNENTPTQSISLYASTKDDAEKYVLWKHCNTICYRLATVFGYSKRARLDLLVNTIIYEAFFNKEVELFDGHYRRNYVHIQDVVDGIIFAVQNWQEMLSEVFNLGNDELNCRKSDLVAKIRENMEFTVKETGRTDVDRRDYEVTSDKLAKKGFMATRSLENGISEMVEFYSMLPKNVIERDRIVKYMRNA